MEPKRIDVIEFVTWLLTLPPMKRVKPIPARQLLDAAALLNRVGYQDEAIRALGQELVEFAALAGAGRVASIGQCVATLKRLHPALSSSGRVKHAIDFIQNLSLEARNSARRPRIVSVEPHYASDDGASVLGPQFLSKLPSNDLSERIWVASQVLKNAGCPTWLQTIAEILGEECTSARVFARLKPFGNRQLPPWPHCHWHLRFWDTRNPDSRMLVPSNQPFILNWPDKKRPRSSGSGLNVRRGKSLKQ